MSDATHADTCRELIQSLCLEAGRIMEDASADLALALPDGSSQIAERVDQLYRAAEDILALASAARSVCRERLRSTMRSPSAGGSEMNLIEQLLARTAMLMEDASSIALVAGEGSQGGRVAEVRGTIDEIQALLGAASAIERYLPG